MPTSTDSAQERQELRTLLGSGIFNRAPSLAQLLSYICEKHFEGSAGQIKEYNIAVEALGRPADFDQKRDSIVRVEAHRLRRRLKDYYEGAGSDHAVRILIPSGQYAPKFVPQETRLRTEPDALSRLDLQPASHVRQLETIESPRFEFSALAPSRRHRWLWATALLLVFLTGAVLAGTWLKRSPAVLWGEPKSSFAFEDPAPNGEEIRIMAGSPRPYTDRFGRVWEADRYFEGGATFSSPDHPVLGTRDPKIYQNRRDGLFRYNIPLKPGSYELRLHFAETMFGETNIAGGGETSRLFNVFANGKQILDVIDVIADAGPNAADIRAFKDLHPDSDGYLHLDFKPVINIPFLNAIEITPGSPGKLRPIRILAQDQPYTDKLGRAWGPDRFVRGGQQVLRSSPVSGAADPEVYRGERFGNLQYAIPVPPGRYTVIVHFAETWFGPDKPVKGGVGSRSFDLLCDGVALLRGLDIYKEAGGDDRALDRTFHGLVPNPQGKLVLSFVPIKNYAEVNAIEVLDEAALSGPDRLGSS